MRRRITGLDHVDRILRSGSGASERTRMPEGSRVYIRIDIDVLDPSIVPETSTPEPSGLSYDELHDSLGAIAERADMVGFDLVEVNPMIDTPTQLTAFVGVHLIVEFLGPFVEQLAYRARHPFRTGSSS